MIDKRALGGLFVTGLLAGSSVALAADPAGMSVSDISACMRANVVDRGSLRDFELRTTDREGKVITITVKVFWKPSRDDAADRITMQVIAPDAYAGTSYLLIAHPDNQQVHLYLPALDRVQVMTGGDMSQPLWGTDFTFSEIKHVLGILQDGDTERLADTRTFDRPTFLLDTRTDEEQTGYLRVKAHVDQQTCTVLKSELYSEGDTPRKLLEADMSTLTEVDPYWLMLGYRMRDLTAGTRTDLKLSEVYLMEVLPESLFTPEGFHTLQE